MAARDAAPLAGIPLAQRLSEALAHSQDVVYSYDAVTDRFDYLGGEFDALTGLRGEDFLGHCLERFLAQVHPRDRQSLSAAFSPSEPGENDGRRLWSLQYRLRKANGAFLWVSHGNTTVLAADGSPLYHSGSFRDITKRKLAEELPLDEDTLHGILEAAPFPITVTTPGEGEVLFANRSAYAFYGFDPETERIVLTPDLYVTPEARRAIVEQLRRDGSASAVDIEMRRLSGGTVWMSFAAQLIRFRGQPAIMSAQFDVTARKQAEEALRGMQDELGRRVRERTAELEVAKRALEQDIAARIRAEEEKRDLERQLRRSQVLEAVGQLAGGVAHDFNNLLGAILGCLHAASARVTDDGAEEEFSRIRTLCKRGGDLTRRLLEVARQFPGEPQAVDLSEVLRDLTPLLGYTVPRNIRIRTQVPEGLPRVLADRSVLTAALLNLIRNAHDAMPTGGTLSFAARRSTDSQGMERVLLEVCDTGTGIPSAIQERVFEPFFTTKPVGKGSGLGLAMVHAAMREWGGDVSVRPNPDGPGTVFQLTFSLGDRSHAEEPVDPATSGHPLVQDAILIVEDEDATARFEEDVLRARGYTTVRAASGLEAFELLSAAGRRYGLAVLDLLLPSLDGGTVHRLLKSCSPTTPVLFVTGRYDLAPELDPGAPVVRKPFSEDDLLEGVERALQRR
ncbi:MAG: PAS domain S-box protein [Deltaproteobacteria bacterium]|nr:PAS domain S-box protein [Deltaproteobacteria bacterium]